jgi:hypothetical protein
MYCDDCFILTGLLVLLNVCHAMMMGWLAGWSRVTFTFSKAQAPGLPVRSLLQATSSE